jgi:hypothetical protein
MMRFGTLQGASCSRACASSTSSTSAGASGRSTTTAATASIHFGSGTAITATSATAGWVKSASSTSRLATSTPPVLIRSLVRSTIAR